MSALQEAQEDLRRSESLSRAIFDGALDAMLLADDAGRYVDVNPAACELFGLPREQLLGHTPADFAAPGYDGTAHYQTFLQTGRMSGQFPLLRFDGQLRTLEFNAVASVAPGRHLSVLRDVTARTRAEVAMRESRDRL